jgi:hypothetical protein
MSVNVLDGTGTLKRILRDIATLRRAAGRDNTPPGAVLFGAWAYPPSGYVLANGATHLVDDLPRLFAVVEHRYGGTGQSFAVPSVAAPSGLIAVVKT